MEGNDWIRQEPEGINLGVNLTLDELILRAKKCLLHQEHQRRLLPPRIMTEDYMKRRIKFAGKVYEETGALYLQVAALLHTPRPLVDPEDKFYDSYTELEWDRARKPILESLRDNEERKKIMVIIDNLARPNYTPEEQELQTLQGLYLEYSSDERLLLEEVLKKEYNSGRPLFS